MVHSSRTLLGRTVTWFKSTLFVNSKEERKLYSKLTLGRKCNFFSKRKIYLIYVHVCRTLTISKSLISGKTWSLPKPGKNGKLITMIYNSPIYVIWTHGNKGLLLAKCTFIMEQTFWNGDTLAREPFPSYKLILLWLNCRFNLEKGFGKSSGKWIYGQKSTLSFVC